MVRMALNVLIVDAVESPLYQGIARKALQLHELGFSASAIARNLGVNDKTAAKSIKWILGQ